MTRLVTLSPSVPASGLSLTENVIESVGGSIGCAVQRLDLLEAAQCVGDIELLEAGDGDDVARDRLLDGHALDAAESEDFSTRGPARQDRRGDRAPWPERWS